MKVWTVSHVLKIEYTSFDFHRGRLLIPNSEWLYKVPDCNVQTSSIAEHVWSLANVHRFANMRSRFSFKHGIIGNRGIVLENLGFKSFYIHFNPLSFISLCTSWGHTCDGVLFL